MLAGHGGIGQRGCRRGCRFLRVVASKLQCLVDGFRVSGLTGLYKGLRSQGPKL